jgi:hypothetical protein
MDVSFSKLKIFTNTLSPFVLSPLSQRGREQREEKEKWVFYSYLFEANL